MEQTNTPEQTRGKIVSAGSAPEARTTGPARVILKGALEEIQMRQKQTREPDTKVPLPKPTHGSGAKRQNAKKNRSYAAPKTPAEHSPLRRYHAKQSTRDTSQVIIANFAPDRKTTTLIHYQEFINHLPPETLPAAKTHNTNNNFAAFPGLFSSVETSPKNFIECPHARRPMLWP